MLINIILDTEKLKEEIYLPNKDSEAQLMATMYSKLDYLESHNKNYTKKQYAMIDDLKTLFLEMCKNCTVEENTEGERKNPLPTIRIQ